jgi:chemotaxis signal transduction protein
MTTLVCFRTGHGAYAVPVEATVAVRPATGLVHLPGSRAGVAGVLPGDPPLTVLTALGHPAPGQTAPGHPAPGQTAPGGGRQQVLVVRFDNRDYGLLVEEVTGLRRVESDDIGPAPAGQDLGFFTGVLQRDTELTLIADPAVLAALAGPR